MTVSFERADFERRIALVDDLVQKVESAPDPVLRAAARDLVQTLMELHGTGLERIVAVLQRSGQAGHVLLQDMLRDELIQSLLLLYELHPVDITTRVQQALEKTRPLLKSHGGNVELVGIVDGEVQLRLQGSCHGCPSSSVTLKMAIEKAIHEAAPDVTAIVVSDAPSNGTSDSALVQISVPNGKVTMPPGGWPDANGCPAAGALA